MGDEEILDHIAGDQEGGLARVSDKYGATLLGRLYAYAARRSYGNAGVEDVYQEILITLLDPAVRMLIISRGGQLVPWLTRLGKWRLDDHGRHRVSQLDSEMPAPQSPEEIVPPSAEAERVRRCLRQLAARDQILLTLRYDEGRREAEIAAELDMSPGAAKKALHDARLRLKAHLERDIDDEAIARSESS